MNRDLPPSSDINDEPDFHSIGKRSADEFSSADKEESKSQDLRQDLQTAQGLYISLTTAQAYSIMRNIPRNFRLIEKTNFKKQAPKAKQKQVHTPKRAKKRDMV